MKQEYSVRGDLHTESNPRSRFHRMTLMIQQRPGQRAGIGNPAGKERAVDESVCERVWDSLEGEGPEIGRKSQIQAQAVHSASRGLIRDAQGRSEECSCPPRDTRPWRYEVTEPDAPIKAVLRQRGRPGSKQ